MGVLRLAGFSGMWPIRDARALPDNAALYGRNLDCDGGAYLKGNRPHTFVQTLLAGTATVFRIPLSGANTLANSYWMQFQQIDAQVHRGPLVNDSFERFYWGSPVGLRYAPKASILAFGASYADVAGFQLGVPAPATAPVVSSITGGTAPIVTRQYVVTFVNAYGEESAPSLPVEADGNANGVWNIDPIPQPPAPGAYATFSAIRLYRTVTSYSSGLTDFFKVVDLSVGTTTYADSIPDTSLIDILDSTNYALPPAGTQGLVLMPNGIFVTWKDNNLYFSENYRPHAWPPDYTLTVDSPIVGLASYGNSCVVCTTGKPSIVTGTKAGAMALQKTDAPLPCVSRRSIAAAPEGVYYASEEGLVLIASGSVNTVTNELISREQWRDDFGPPSQLSIVQGGEYISMITDAEEGFRFWPQQPATRGVSFFDVNGTAVNIGIEAWTGKPWVIADVGGARGLYEFETPGGVRVSYEWRSREFIYPYPANFVVYQCFFDDTPTKTLQLKIEVTLRGNDGSMEWREVYNRPVPFSGREVKLPSGFKSDIWRFTSTGDAELQAFMIASSAQELRSA
jgi:hypothetical protein